MPEIPDLLILTDPPAPPEDRPPGRRWPSRLFNLATLAYLAACSAGVAVAMRDFGIRGLTLALALMPTIPLVIAERLRLRQPAVRRREYAYLAFVLIVVTAGSIAVVREWYRIDLTRMRPDQTQFGALARIMGKDPVFHNVIIHPPRFNSPYWVNGRVDTRTDFNRLYALASSLGIEDRINDHFTSFSGITIDEEFP